MPLIAVECTDKDVWREPGTDNPNRIFVTESGGVGLSFGGRVVVKTLQAWVNLGWQDTTQDVSLAERVEKLEEAVRELNPGLRL